MQQRNYVWYIELQVPVQAGITPRMVSTEDFSSPVTNARVSKVIDYGKYRSVINTFSYHFGAMAGLASRALQLTAGTEEAKAIAQRLADETEIVRSYINDLP